MFLDLDIEIFLNLWIIYKASFIYGTGSLLFNFSD